MFRNYNPLINSDPDIHNIIEHEYLRQRQHIELIASENIVSTAVLEAQGSVLTNKYAEGYSGKRYYGGCEHVDKAEDLAIERVKKLFNCNFANVQPHSGAQANGAVFLALLQPGDTILGMGIDQGGHLSHGAAPNISGKWFKAVSYGVRKDNGLIDYDQVKNMAMEHKPKMIIAGGSAYSRIIDFKIFKDIANQVGAYLLVDMAHFSGLVAGGVYPNPIEYADVITSTTHKVLRGPRGGIILTNNEELAKKFNSAVFPGLQGGPLMHVIAAKAVCFQEALQDDFKEYTKKVVDNARTLCATLQGLGYTIFSGGTDTHLMLVDLRPMNITGKLASESLGRANITCNKNGIPYDDQKPWITSGIRLGTPACTTRGFGAKEFNQVGLWIDEILKSLIAGNNLEVEPKIQQKVLELCEAFPVFSN